jgi:DNA-binding CsgD family transcriptional regulator
MLLGREAETERLGGAIEAARHGRSSVVLIQGDPGIGKTSLLAWAEDRAADFQVCRVRGSQVEARIAFAGLFDLLRPFLPLLDRIPDSQAGALASALGLGPPRQVDRLAVYAASLFLVATAAEHSRLLITVDDVGWLDESSQEAFAFVFRRLEREPAACLVSGRTGELGLFSDLDLPRLALGGVHGDSAAAIVRSSVSLPLADHVVEELSTATGGNPLALTELPRLLSELELSGTAPLRNPLPVARAIEEAFGKRVDSLSEGCARAVLLMAVAVPEEWPVVLAAAERMGIDPGWTREAEQLKVLAVHDGEAWFSHPLLRPVVLRRSSEAERRSAHALLSDLSADVERRAWHRAAAADGADEPVGAELETVAAAAATRGSPAVASLGFERAAELASDPDVRDRRLLAAAELAGGANHLQRAVSMTDRVIAASANPGLSARARFLRGQFLMFDGHSVEVANALAAEGEAIRERDPAGAALLLGFGAMVETIHGGCRGAYPRALEARLLVDRDGILVDLTTSVAVAMVGAALGLTQEVLDEAARWPVPFPIPEGPLQTFVFLGAVQGVLASGDIGRAQELADSFVQHFRRSGVLGYLAYPLGLRSVAAFRLGNWIDAYADASEAVRLQRSGTLHGLATLLSVLAQVEAGLGHVGAAADHAAEGVAIGRRHRIVSSEIPALAAVGLVDLAQGRPRDALAPLTDAAALSVDTGFAPGCFWFHANLVEAAVRSGREDVAADQVEQLRSSVAQQPWVEGTMLRGLGLLADGDESERQLRSATQRYREAGSPFDEARAMLDLGVRLRRHRKPIDARDTILGALGILERLGAAPWVDMARDELRVSGGTLSERGRTIENLSPAELQVAIVVGRGATNREAAAELFLSPKTVDHHLSRIYSKLGLRSRAELARHMAAQYG